MRYSYLLSPYQVFEIGQVCYTCSTDQSDQSHFKGSVVTGQVYSNKNNLLCDQKGNRQDQRLFQSSGLSMSPFKS